MWQMVMSWCGRVVMRTPERKVVMRFSPLYYKVVRGPNRQGEPMVGLQKRWGRKDVACYVRENDLSVLEHEYMLSRSERKGRKVFFLRPYGDEGLFYEMAGAFMTVLAPLVGLLMLLGLYRTNVTVEHEKLAPRIKLLGEPLLA